MAQLGGTPGLRDERLRGGAKECVKETACKGVHARVNCVRVSMRQADAVAVSRRTKALGMANPTIQALSSAGARVFVLLSHQKKVRAVELRDGAPVGETMMPSGLPMLAAFSSGGDVRLVVAGKQGKTRVVTPGGETKSKSIAIPTAGTGPDPLKRGYLLGLKTVGGRPTLSGMRGQLYTWSGAEWVDERQALLEAMPGGVGQYINDVVDVDGEPAVLFDRAGGGAQVAFRRAGAWHAGAVTERVNAGAWRESDGTLFAVGETAWAFPLEGGAAARELPEPPWPLWAAAVFNDELFVSNSRSVHVLRGNHFEEVVASGTSGGDRALSVHDGALYFMRRDALEVFDGRAWRTIPSTALV